MISTPDLLVTVILVSVGGAGVLLNLGFLILSFVKRNVTSKLDYRWFLYGLCFVNLLYTINMSTIQPYITIMQLDPHGQLCFISGYFTMALATGGVLCQSLLSISRYYAMFHSDLFQQYFSSRNCIIMVAVAYGIAGIGAFSFVLLDEYGRFEGICSIAVYTMKMWHMFLFFTSPLLISYGVSLFCAYKISTLIKRQTGTDQTREWQSKIKEAKFIIRFIYLEVFLPIVMENPVFILLFLNSFFTIPREVMALSLACFISHATTDPIIMVLVIKPYRKMLVALWHRAVHGGKVTAVECTTKGMSTVAAKSTTAK